MIELPTSINIEPTENKDELFSLRKINEASDLETLQSLESVWEDTESLEVRAGVPFTTRQLEESIQCIKRNKPLIADHIEDIVNSFEFYPLGIQSQTVQAICSQIRRSLNQSPGADWICLLDQGLSALEVITEPAMQSLLESNPPMALCGNVGSSDSNRNSSRILRETLKNAPPDTTVFFIDDWILSGERFSKIYSYIAETKASNPICIVVGAITTDSIYKIRDVVDGRNPVTLYAHSHIRNYAELFPDRHKKIIDASMKEFLICSSGTVSVVSEEKLPDAVHPAIYHLCEVREILQLDEMRGRRTNRLQKLL